MGVNSRALSIALALAICSSLAATIPIRAQSPPGLLLVELTVKDAKQFEEYGAKSRPVVAAHKGVPMFRATDATALFGDQPHKVLIGFRFPSKAAISDFYASADYQALLPLRTAAADTVFTAYDLEHEHSPKPSGALLAVKFNVKNPSEFATYGKATGPLVQAQGGQPYVRAVNPEVLSGENRYSTLVLFTFPSQAAIRAFYASEPYQKLIPARTAAADMVFTGYDL